MGFLLAFIVPAAGCIESTEAIDRIELYPVHNPQETPPGAWLFLEDNDPMPANPWEFREHVVTGFWVRIRINKDLKENVTFTKYTIFCTADSSEKTVGQPDDLGPYEPGQVVLLNHGRPWQIPAAYGQYEFRVYLGDRIVSQAFFNVLDLLSVSRLSSGLSSPEKHLPQ